MTKVCYVCNGTCRSKLDKNQPCSFCKGQGKLPDVAKDEWNMCRNCNHAIFKINNEWKHCIPMNPTQICNNKTCNCGGNGFEIYGLETRRETCGICNQGKICNCINPEPMPYLTLK